MGQQQLLLLVLATVIVGLATVAGIQAFEESKTRATQDALQQRAISVGANLQATLSEPSMFRGNSSKVAPVVVASGYEGKTGISAPGAGDNATCDVEDGQKVGDGSYKNGMTIICSENASGGSSSQSVTVEVGERQGPTVVKLNGNDLTN